MFNFYRQPTSPHHNRVPEVIVPISYMGSHSAQAKQIDDLLFKVNTFQSAPRHKFTFDDKFEIGVVRQRSTLSGSSKFHDLIRPWTTYCSFIRKNGKKMSQYLLSEEPVDFCAPSRATLSLSVPPKMERHTLDVLGNPSVQTLTNLDRVQKFTYIPSYGGFGRKVFYDNDLGKFNLSFEEAELIIALILPPLQFTHFTSTQYYQYAKENFFSFKKEHFSFNLLIFAFYIYCQHLSCLFPYSEEQNLTELLKSMKEKHYAELEKLKDSKIAYATRAALRNIQREEIFKAAQEHRKKRIDSSRFDHYTPDEMLPLQEKADVFVITNFLANSLENPVVDYIHLTNILKFYTSGNVVFRDI